MARLLFALAALVSATIWSSSALAAGGTFSDSSGDATNGAPDITSVAADESSGTVTFTLAVAGVSALESAHRYEIRINSDNASTGDNGIDQVLVLNGPNREVSHWRWNGSAFELSAVHGLSGTATAPFKLTIAAASLGDPATIAFWARSIELNTKGYDDAPNTGAYTVAFRTQQTQPGQPGQPSQPGNPGQPEIPPLPPAPPSFDDLPSLPPLPTPPSPGSGTSPGGGGTPEQPRETPAQPGTGSSSGPGPALASLRSARLAVVPRGQQRRVLATISFRLPDATVGVTTTCAGTLGGRPLKLRASRTGGTVACAAAVARTARGVVRVRMTVNIGHQRFVRTFRYVLRRG